MNNLKKSLVIGLLLSSGAAVANDGMYVSLGFGFNKTNTIKDSHLPMLNNIDMAQPVAELGLIFKNGKGLSLAIGQKFNDLRAEAEFSHFKAKYKRFTQEFGRETLVGDDAMQGSLKSNALIANVYYDLPFVKMVVPYVGVGIGLAHIQNQVQITHDPIPGFFDGGTFKTKVTDLKLAYQGILGVTLNVNETMSVGMDYRYLSTSKLKALDKKLSQQAMQLKLTYRF